ncbi:MAG TPA: hypothetical protein VK540_23010 [Polyangiaceae bacterium]|nr:hypothetical protein [Polyangiaceae bacterium]
MRVHQGRGIRPKSAIIASAFGCADRELFAALLVFWVISLARVVVGVACHETFGAEGSLAFLAVLLVPWLMKDAIVQCPSPQSRPR